MALSLGTCSLRIAAGALRPAVRAGARDLGSELSSFSDTINRTAGVASEGWKLLNEASGRLPGAALRQPASDAVRSEVMMQGNLDTTNLLLGIMAVVSVAGGAAAHRARRRRP